MTSALLVVGLTHLVLCNAYELQDGKAARSISQEEAAEIVERMVSEEDEIPGTRSPRCGEPELAGQEGCVGMCVIARGLLSEGSTRPPFFLSSDLLFPHSLTIEIRDPREARRHHDGRRAGICFKQPRRKVCAIEFVREISH